MADVRRRGETLASLARRHGLSRQSFSWALIKPHIRANEAIAAFLGTDVHTLWPEWFDASGAPRFKSISRRSR